MGCADSTQKQNQQSDFTQQTTFNPASAEETALRQQFSGLGTQQNQALQSLLQQVSGGTSPFALSPADQAQLDQAYQGSINAYNMQAKQYADQLAGGRGMRMSDTPISAQAMQQYGLGMGDILSNKAMQGLNMGLSGNQFRANTIFQGANALPSGSVAAFNPLFQERLASGTTRTQGNTSGTTVSTPSLMSQIQQGIGIAGSLGSMGAGFMSGMPGAGAAAGGASAGGSGGLGSLGPSVLNASSGLGLGGGSFNLYNPRANAY